LSIPLRPNARLLFRVDPLPHENPRGYLCRVAHAHGYSGPLYLAQIAALSPSGLERGEGVEQVSYVLRLEPEEWRAPGLYTTQLTDAATLSEFNRMRPRGFSENLCRFVQLFTLFWIILPASKYSGLRGRPVSSKEVCDGRISPQV